MNLVDFFRELADAAQARIRSPFIGSIILVFLALNWKAVAILLFTDVDIAQRIEAFEGMTNNQSLILKPLVLGILIALALPWSRLVGVVIARKPLGLLRKLQHDESQALRIYRYEGDAKEAEARARLEEATERAKIDAAKRLEEAQKIGPELEKALVEERGQVEGTHKGSNTLETWERELLEMAAATNDGKVYFSPEASQSDPGLSSFLSNWKNTHRDRKELFEVFRSLDARGFLDLKYDVRRSGDAIGEITAMGYRQLKKS